MKNHFRADEQEENKRRGNRGISGGISMDILNEEEISINAKSCFANCKSNFKDFISFLYPWENMIKKLEREFFQSNRKHHF
jgi:hypothetical protein